MVIGAGSGWTVTERRRPGLGMAIRWGGRGCKVDGGGWAGVGGRARVDGRGGWRRRRLTVRGTGRWGDGQTGQRRERAAEARGRGGRNGVGGRGAGERVRWRGRLGQTRGCGEGSGRGSGRGGADAPWPCGRVQTGWPHGDEGCNGQTLDWRISSSGAMAMTARSWRRPSSRSRISAALRVPISCGKGLIVVSVGTEMPAIS